MQRKNRDSKEQLLYPVSLILQFILHAQGWWAHLSSPKVLPLDAPLAQREAVLRGQLTSKVLLILLIIAFFYVPVIISLAQPLVTGVYAAMLGLLLLAAPLNRRRKSTLAGFIVMMTIEMTLVMIMLTFPVGMNVITLPVLDFLVIPTLVAASLLPPLSVFPTACMNIAVIFFVVFFLPKSTELQVVFSSSPQSLCGIPVLLQLIIASISFLWVRGSMEALKEASRADTLDHLYHEQSRVAETDSVTGLPNHRAIMSRLQVSLKQSEQTQEPCALLFMDLDHFKQINDTWGHLAGDAVLREAGRRLQNTIAAYGNVGRYGGEEFAGVLKGLNLSQVCQLAEQARIALASTPCLWQVEDTLQKREIQVTASIGIALYGLHGNTDATLIESADQAMYQAKLQGRNCVRVATESGNTYTMQREGQQAEKRSFLRPLKSA